MTDMRSNKPVVRMESFSDRLKRIERRISSAEFKRHFAEQGDKMMALGRLLDFHKVRYCFLGGVVLPFYNYVRMTESMDTLVHRDDYGVFMGIPEISKTHLTGKAVSAFQGTPLNIIASESATGFHCPHPKELAEKNADIKMISFKRLLWMKVKGGLNPNRLKDLGDLQELIRCNKPSRDYLDEFGGDIKSKYQEIWDCTMVGRTRHGNYGH